MELWAAEFRFRKELHYTTEEFLDLPAEKFYFFLGLLEAIDRETERQLEEAKKNVRTK